MPNLQNLRKQAKLYLRWHRTGYYPVAVQIREALTRFRDLSDDEILASPFKLSDAQELVARKAGFEGWTALIGGIDAMTTTRQPENNGEIVLAAEPQLFVPTSKPLVCSTSASSASR